MLTVKTILQPSALEGLGLFAGEKIPKGASVWQFDPRFDLQFSAEEVERLPQLQKSLIKKYAYLSIDSGKYIYSGDDARFMNHSSKMNNLEVVHYDGETETRSVAKRDIEIGEELLVDYRAFDATDANSSEEYLKG